jgi:hypothetical protein
LSFRDVEDLLAEGGIMVSYESIRRWVNHFGPMIAADLRKRWEKAAIVRVIHPEPSISEMFCQSSGPDHPRRSRLVDQLFNSSEKRLARVLLQLANLGKESKPEPIIAKAARRRVFVGWKATSTEGKPGSVANHRVARRQPRRNMSAALRRPCAALIGLKTRV